MNRSRRPSRLFLVDGYGYVFRSFYAIPLLTTRSGVPTNAVSGFCSILVRLLAGLGHATDEEDKLVAVALDTGQPTFRHALYPLYKQNRTAPPRELVSQFPLIHAAVDAFGLPILHEVGFEADDLIATYAQRGRHLGIPVTVVSSDKDLLQLVGQDGITFLESVKFSIRDVAYVRERYGVEPQQLVDLFSLTGDSSDNIPGVPGVGPKTAAQLIQTYGSLEGIFSRIHTVPSKLKRDALVASRDQAFLSRDLIRLCANAPENTSLEDMRPSRLRRTDKLMAFLEEMELHRLAERISSLATREEKACAPAENKGGTVSDLEAIKKEAIARGYFSFALDVRNGGIVTLNGISSFKFEGAHAPPLRFLFESESILTIGHDIKACSLFLAEKGVCLSAFDDVMLMAYVADGGLLPNYTLDALYQHYQSADLISLWKLLGKRLLEVGRLRLYHLLEKPMVAILAKMEAAGIGLDCAYLKQLSENFQERIQVLERSILQEAGSPFNIGSPKQLGEVLFEKLGYISDGKTKTGVYRTDSETLESLATQQGATIATNVLCWRMLNKLKNTYVDPLTKLVNPQTGRIHPTFLLASTSTGRLACQAPNLQNVPIRTPEGRQVRRCFVAQPGYRLLCADYNQIELRVLAYIANIPTLKRAFREDLDIHTLTASQVFGVPEAGVDDSLRRKAKAVNFGILYGLSSFGLARQLSITQTEARGIIERYFARFPEIKTYVERVVADFHAHKHVTTLMGRSIHIAPSSPSFGLANKRAAERAAINAPIQGSASDIIRLAMLRIDQNDALIPGRMLLQIHDELLFEVPEDRVAEAALVIKDLMENAHRNDLPDFDVPLAVDTQVGARWGEA